jgi:DNA invertase Pin-like site-specific DNA recombinase
MTTSHLISIERVQDILRCGDVLVVWRLDGLGRSLKHVIELMGELDGQGKPSG